MNDEELNQIISRTDEEVGLFRDIDLKRERDAVESWRLAGNRGKPPPPLMQFDELPECYQTDEPFEVKELEDVLEGRGQRRRNIVNYNDGLSDEQWAMVRNFLLLISQCLTRSWATPIRLSRREKTCRSSQNVLEARRIDGWQINF